LGEECDSDVVQEIAGYLPMASAYENVVDLFHPLLGQSLGNFAVQLMVAEGPEDVAAYYEQQAAPAVSEAGRILVVQVDGMRMPLAKETEAMHRPTNRCGMRAIPSRPSKTPQRQAWVAKRALYVLGGRTTQVIAALRSLAQMPGTTAEQEQLHATAD
jgi:hypothetical protein